MIEFRKNKSLKMNYYYLHFIPTKINQRSIFKYSVMLYLFDAASRFVFKRQMKNTIKVLKYISKDNNIYEMLRYHSVGPRSIENYLPLFYGTNDLSKKHKIIFEDFEENKFISIILLEDCHSRSELYGNTSYSGANHSIILGCELSWIFKYGSKPRCIANKQYHQLYLDYLNTAATYYSNKSTPFISYISFMESHEKQQISLLRVDQDFSQHLLLLHKKNILKNTILIMLGDHGIQYGPYFETEVC